MDTAKSIRTSSWDKHDYSLLFYGLVRGQRPSICVELGTYAGYSAFQIGTALKHNGFGVLHCYDLWESYPFNKVPMRVAEDNLKDLPVDLHKEDAFNAHSHYQPMSVDLLNVDVSNDGDTYLKILLDWYPLLSPLAYVLLEGGSPERDQVEWMIKYNKKPILSALRNYQITSRYEINVLPYFPGLTILKKVAKARRTDD